MPPKAIPDRWIPYKSCGKVIEGTRFICFKVPLERKVQKNNREIKKIWDVPTLLEDIPKLGAVIDLTNTARYYNPMDFLKANIMHRKILMPGRVLPPESSVKEFMDAVDEFLAKDGDSLIGVHCTHGLNRTGYMVCLYMRDKLGIPAQEAISKFEEARGYKMERPIYIKNILGKLPDEEPSNIGELTEVTPVYSRRNDITYKSPLSYGRDSPPVNYNQRYGNSSSNNDRFGYNRYSTNQSSNSTRNSAENGLFSCYTNRYTKEKSSSGSKIKSSQDRRLNESPLSWRKKKESSEDIRSNKMRTGDSSGHNRNKRDDRSRTIENHK